MADSEVNAPENIVASSDDETQTDVVDLTGEEPTERGEFEVMITETVTETETPEETVVVSTGPLSTSWRVFTNDRTPVYLTAAGIAVMGIVEFPVLIGGLIAYEGLRRLVPRS